MNRTILYSTRSQSALFDAPFWLQLRQSQKKCSTAWEAASALFFRLPRFAQKCAAKKAHILTASSIMTSLCVVLTGCAAKTPNFKQTQEDERVAILLQMGKDHADEIERLKGRFEKLEAHWAAPRVSRKILIPNPTSAKPTQNLIELAGEAVADSRHEPMHLYFKAFQALENGHPDVALHDLDRFLIIQPNHVYADRAQFLIAEAQFRNHEYGLALTEYQTLERKFPYSFKVPESMFQRALILIQMDQKEGARALFRELLSKYPNHPAAKMALRKVTELQTPPLIERAQN